MKKLILIALTICLLATCAACTKKAETSEPAGAPEAAEASNEAQAPAQDAPVPVEAPDPEATAFASAEALAAGIAQARETAAGARTDAQTVLAALDEIYVPDADFEGFELLGVEAQEGFLIYYYMPADGPAYDGFDYRRGITVTVCTDPSVTLEQVCGQMGLTPEADGFAYDEEHQQLYFSQEGHACSLQMPEGTADPEAMKAFCRIKRFDVN